MGEWTTIIGGFFGAALLFIFVGILTKLRDRLLKKIGKQIKSTYTLSSESVKMSRAVEQHLYRLRDLFDAARISVFQFHNGEVFMLADHSWKLTCTHEIVAPGVTHTLKDNQNMLASQLIDLVDPVVTGETARTPGCHQADFCVKKQGECDIANHGHQVFLYKVSEMMPSVSKYMLEAQGTGAFYCAPLRATGKAEPTAGTAFGFIAVQFRTLSDLEARQVESAGSLCRLCAAVADIQFLLHQAWKPKV